MSQQYCDKHSRIELENGLCVACGQVEYRKREMTDKDRLKILAKAYGGFFLLFIALFIITLYFF